MGGYPVQVPEATRGWLEGPGYSRAEAPGARLGLPEAGPGSIAGFGPRTLAFLVDAVVANLIAGLPYLFGVRYSPGVRTWVVAGVFMVVHFVAVSATGQTLGMRLLRLRVVRLSDGQDQRPGWVAVRTVLMALVIPVLIWDRDQRGMHDRAAGAVMLNDPAPLSQG